MHYREYIRATGVSAIFNLAMFIIYPILSPYIKSFGLDDFQLSLVFAVLPLFMILSSPIIGRLADDIGRTKMIIFGLIIAISSMALYIFGTYWWIVVIARILDAIAFAGVTLILIAKVEDNLNNSERGKYAGWSLSITHLGAIIGPVIGGLLADAMFVKAPFILTALILLVLGFMVALKDKTKKKKIKRESFDLFLSIKNFLKLDSLKGLGIMGFVMHATSPAMSVFLPLYLFEKIGVSYLYIGVALFFYGITHIFQSYFGKISDKHGRVSMILFGTFTFGLFMFFIPFTKVYWVLILILLFQGTGGAIWNISAWSLMSDIGEATKKEGELLGSFMSISKTGAFISFIFSGLIVQLFGMKSLFILNAFIIAIGIIFASYFFIGSERLLQRLKIQETK